MEKLTEWYGDPEDSEDMDVGGDRAIEQFNHLVRKELSDVCLAMMSGRDVLWRYMYLLIGMSLVLQEPANVSVPSMSSAQSIACKRAEHRVLSARTVRFQSFQKFPLLSLRRRSLRGYCMIVSCGRLGFTRKSCNEWISHSCSGLQGFRGWHAEAPSLFPWQSRD